jgi:hypothetical protein
MSTRATAPTLVSVYSGRTCLGFVLARGCRGFEAYAADERSLGLFPNQRDAANAITDAADKEEA